MSKVVSIRCTDEEQTFINTALKWFRAQRTLVELGSISVVPNPFAATRPTTNAEPASESGQDPTKRMESVEACESKVYSLFQQIAKQYNQYQQYPWVFQRAWNKIRDIHAPSGVDICCAIEEQISCIDR